ncbi:hypothetical protein C4D60_Mb05t13230 [Musa balbisiana]|uniref:Uncharacterized protein n=1 Tax=Musa balbisiana TaxID=52838 RepID=A0A4S8JVT9_MUSBA|nr:hypothetical protein C4D60_Mb05t13230 [Musa balbisiana]
MQVNNAGSAIWKPATEQTPEDYKFVMSTNLESAFHLSQLAHPLLKASGSGSSIVFISSVAGLVGFDGICLYSATKGTRRARRYTSFLEQAINRLHHCCLCLLFHRKEP